MTIAIIILAVSILILASVIHVRTLQKKKYWEVERSVIIEKDEEIFLERRKNVELEKLVNELKLNLSIYELDRANENQPNIDLSNPEC